MVAMILIGFVIAFVGWGAIQLLPVPRARGGSFWRFTPIFLFALGLMIAIGTGIVAAWRMLL